MLKKYAPIAIACIICMALFYVFGPKRVETKIIEKEVIVEKEIVVTKRDIIKTKITKPDGTIIEKETDKSVIEKEKDTETKKDKKTVIKHLKRDWSVGVGRILTTTDGDFYITVERRILANISIGVMATTSKTVGAHVSIRF